MLQVPAKRRPTQNPKRRSMPNNNQIVTNYFTATHQVKADLNINNNIDAGAMANSHFDSEETKLHPSIYAQVNKEYAETLEKIINFNFNKLELPEKPLNR